VKKNWAHDKPSSQAIKQYFRSWIYLGHVLQMLLAQNWECFSRCGSRNHWETNRNVCRSHKI